jgi:hypothetical protein
VMSQASKALATLFCSCQASARADWRSISATIGRGRNMGGRAFLRGMGQTVCVLRPAEDHERLPAVVADRKACAAGPFIRGCAGLRKGAGVGDRAATGGLEADCRKRIKARMLDRCPRVTADRFEPNLWKMRNSYPVGCGWRAALSAASLGAEPDGSAPSRFIANRSSNFRPSSTGEDGDRTALACRRDRTVSNCAPAAQGGRRWRTGQRDDGPCRSDSI